MEKIFNKLTELIKNNDEIYIMTHYNPDFDGMGSAIALQQIINKFKKKSYIIKNVKAQDKSLNKAYKYLIDEGIEHCFINKTEALNNIKEDSVLIVLDTHKKQLLEIPDLVDKTDNVVVLDHHVKSKDNIKEGIISYINSNLSSTVELIAHYIKYLNFSINPLVATFLLIGLEIDTNNFKLKTTDKTYETAAFLSRQGADNILKQELLQEEKENYVEKQKLIEQSYMVKDHISLCIADAKEYANQDLAVVAEKLLQFENVEASFVIGKLKDERIGISARSIGTIDVEEIMQQMGGGGHLNEAATQIENSTIEEVKNQLINILGGK